jgi:hypothetical protein
VAVRVGILQARAFWGYSEAVDWGVMFSEGKKWWVIVRVYGLCLISALPNDMMCCTCESRRGCAVDCIV